MNKKPLSSALPNFVEQDLPPPYFAELEDSQVTVFLKNGVKLQGVASNLGNGSGKGFILSRGGEHQIVFWDAVATLSKVGV